jgi:hypothetical protein
VSPNIRIDRQVYQALQKQAEPFVDTPNAVLRRLLGLEKEQERPPEKVHDSGAAPDKPARRDSIPRTEDKEVSTRKRNARTRRSQPPKRGTRAPSDALLPESEYVMPVLQTLAERGGSAPAREVVAEVGRRLGDRLTPLDMESLDSGGIRWQNRVQFVRLRLVEEGLIERKSTRGVWVLTKAGLARARGEAA